MELFGRIVAGAEWGRDIAYSVSQYLTGCEMHARQDGGSIDTEGWSSY